METDILEKGWMDVKAILKYVKGYSVKQGVVLRCVAPGSKIGSSRWKAKTEEKLSNIC